jgi:Zn-dependent M16 (insulinase) family peptidase
VALDELRVPLDKKRVFIVTDRFLYENGYAKPVTEKLAEMDIEQIIEKLLYLQKAIINAGLIANLTGSALKTGSNELAQRFRNYGPPHPRKSAANQASKNVPEVFASPTLQIGFAAMTLKAAPFDSPGQVAQTILAHQMSTGALWEDIRMKGGAYGAFANSDSLEGCFSLASYRDPNPLRSLDAFSAILKKGATLSVNMSESDLVKIIIGCYAKETRPRTSAEKGLTDFFRFLYGIEDDYRKRKLERLVSAEKNELRTAFESLASQTAVSPVVISGPKYAEQAAASLGVEVKMLPC